MKANDLAYDYFIYLNDNIKLYRESFPIGIQRSLTRKINQIKKQCLLEGLDFNAVMKKADTIFECNILNFDTDRI